MSGKIIAIIGGAHQGKSYFTKQQIQSPTAACFVFDYQNAYGETSTKPGDIVLNLPLGSDLKRCRYYGDPKEFIRLATLRRHTTVVIEEATIFLEGKTESTTRKLMVDRYHRKNNIIFQFHSINSVPPRILEMSDIIVLFKTGDDPNIIKRKYSKLLPYFMELKGMPDRSKKIIQNI
jgi:hypothetical protein